MNDFLFISHENTNPYFNLASEEYLLKQTEGYYIYLWINSPAVIVGINQNAVQEVNLSFTEQNNIKVVRRLTGGGAVYHDLGNVCYTIIAPFNKNNDSYREFTAPVIQYLNSLGAKAEFSGRNDICIDGKKISGNAQTIYNNRIMHHGTLLFDTDMSVLTSALKPNKLKTQSKGIKSIRARVTNIKDCLNKEISTKEFFNGLCSYFKKTCNLYNFSNNDLDNINRLVEEKYSKYEWNVGRSPKGNCRFDGKFNFGILTMTFDLNNGKMQNVEIFGDFFSQKPIEEVAQKLNGIEFRKEKIYNALKDISQYINGANAIEISNKIFE